MRINGLQLSAGQLLSRLFPRHCRLCGTRAQQHLCPECLKELPWLDNGCSRCSLPLPVGSDALLCGRCQQQAPAFDHSLAIFHYQPPVDYLVKRLKFSAELALCPFFSSLLEQRIRSRQAPLPELILPVPLHPSRLRSRGFNQSTELARRLGHSLDIPVNNRLCIRTRSTQPQSLLPRAARRKNMSGAFSVNRTLTGSHIAIVDDVMTTGLTCRELARTLKQAGAEYVEVWVVARAGT